MPASNGPLALLRNRHARVLSAVLLLQAAGFHVASRREEALSARPLEQLPRQFHAWRMARQDAIDPQTLEVLRADDTVSRIYVDSANGRSAGLFVAYFRSQRSGQAPHSPKNCMPGSGWVPTESGRVAVQIPGRSEPIRVNRYLVTKGDQKVLVLYWYQSRDRVIAGEYAAKFFLVADAIRHNRSDSALVRVTVPVTSDQDVKAAARTAEVFVQSFFLDLRRFLPA